MEQPAAHNHQPTGHQMIRQGLYVPKNAFSKKLDIWGQKLIFCFGTAIFVNRPYHQYTLGHNFPIALDPTRNFFPR